jgi:hypothetical protein
METFGSSYFSSLKKAYIFACSFIYGLFNDAVSSLGCIASNYRMINGLDSRIWEEAVVA